MQDDRVTPQSANRTTTSYYQRLRAAVSDPGSDKAIEAEFGKPFIAPVICSFCTVVNLRGSLYFANSSRASVASAFASSPRALASAILSFDARSAAAMRSLASVSADSVSWYPTIAAKNEAPTLMPAPTAAITVTAIKTECEAHPDIARSPRIRHGNSRKHLLFFMIFRVVVTSVPEIFIAAISISLLDSRYGE
jgi:hypothetical protein